MTPAAASAAKKTGSTPVRGGFGFDEAVLVR